MPPLPIQIPRDRRERNPLITKAGYRGLLAILEHPDAPRWNYAVGDRLRREDLPALDSFRATLARPRPTPTPAARPPDSLLDWIHRLRPRVPWFLRAIPEGADLARDWAYLPTLCRQDLALRPESLVPADEPLDRLIVYDTSGTTGHAIRVPLHPRAVAQNHPLLERILAQHGVRPAFGPGRVACLNVGAQVNTVVFGNVFSVWNQAGFAKVNLHDRAWSRDKARRFVRDLEPQFLTGDPVGFAEMIRWEIPAQPAAMISTAVALAPALRTRLEARYRCPVIDLYSCTETGPVAGSAPGSPGLRVLPPDLYVEVVDDQGLPLPPGEPGELCVTGGRNPFLPLLRYRTGDRARLAPADPGAPDPAPCLLDLEAREAVVFVAADGSSISPVDIGREIRAWPFVQHEFLQRPDRSCRLTLRPLPGEPLDTDAIRRKLEALFGDGIPVEVRLDERLGQDQPGGKVTPFIGEAALPD